MGLGAGSTPGKVQTYAARSCLTRGARAPRRSGQVGVTRSDRPFHGLPIAAAGEVAPFGANEPSASHNIAAESHSCGTRLQRSPLRQGVHEIPRSHLCIVIRPPRMPRWRHRYFLIPRRKQSTYIMLSILGLATKVPDYTMSPDEAIAMSDDCVCRNEREARILRTIFKRARIENRHLCVPYSTAYDWVPIPPRELSDDHPPSCGPTTAERMQLYAEHSKPLAVASAKAAIGASRLEPPDISHLVTVSCTGFESPGVDVELIETLGLRSTVERIHVGFMGCHGAINGMRAALAVTTAEPNSHLLLVATELCSLHFCFSWEPERLLGNALFSDGSAAMVCGGTAGVGDNDDWQITATGSCLIPNSRHAMTWRIGDFGFDMSLSSEVPDLIKRNLRPWLQAWLNKNDLSIEEIGSWAIHPGGPRIVDAVEESLALPPETTKVSREILRTHGNMSSPTILFILERFRRDDAARPCVALGFGPGLVAEAALIR